MFNPDEPLDVRISTLETAVEDLTKEISLMVSRIETLEKSKVPELNKFDYYADKP